MKKVVLLLLFLISHFIQAQPKTDWAYYGRQFSYSNEKFSDPVFAPAGLRDVIFKSDGTIVYTPANAKEAIIVFKNGQEFSTAKVDFKANTKLANFVRGNETKEAATMLIDKKGTLWFGSYKGLFTIGAAVINSPEKLTSTTAAEGERIYNDTPGMPFNNVGILAQDSKGSVWVSGVKTSGLANIEYKGLSKFDGTQWTNIEVQGMTDKGILKIAFDNQDNPFVVFATNNIGWYKDGQWKSLGKIESGDVTALAYWNNTVYAAGGSTIWAWKNEKWEEVKFNAWIEAVSDLKTDKQNNLWISSRKGVICALPTGAQFTISTENSILPSNDVKKIVIDDEDRKWFITSDGIAGYKEGAASAGATVFNKFNANLPAGSIESIVAAKDGLLLVNHEVGLLQFDGKMITVKTPDNKKELYYNNAVSTKEGKTYVATYRYLHVLDASGYNKLEWKDDIGKQVNSVALDQQGNVWIASNGISKYDGTSWQNFDKKNAGLPSNTCYNLFVDSKNNLWASLNDGIARYDGTTWTFYTKKTAGMALGNMKGVAEGKDGKLWFSNGYKLIEFDGTAMKEVPSFKSVGTLHNMIVDEDGTLLISTEEKGIAKVKDGVTSFCNQATCGLPSDAVSFVYKDGVGNLWAACGLPPKDTSFPTMTMGGQQPATPAPPVNPKDTFNKKLKEFDPAFNLVLLKKY